MLRGLAFAACCCTTIAAQVIPPAQALARMKTPDDLQVRLVASEPQLRQPVALGFDDRGRLWCLQYLQYPTPAGIKAVAVDRYSATKYDNLPDPPPHGPRGADRLTIATKLDGQGRVVETKDFVDGLNLATGFLHGDEGVYVLQSPYLLHYPDRNRDDVPDGPPEVLLTGFGMEDAHAFANSLCWGPDGWLYGVQGSTVTANIRGITFQQGIWRFHPKDQRFELFSEGGGNTWGLDFDPAGHAIASTNMGGVTSLHQVQGAYYVKGFEKHGPLQNPHAYGYFEHCASAGFAGGHVHCGGIVYQGTALPERYRGKIIAADLLANAVRTYELVPDRSTFRTRKSVDALLGHDPAFRPVDCEQGPDGAVYIADWADPRANHVDPKDDWDRSSGRVYALEPKGGSTPEALPEFAKLTTLQLLAFRTDDNVWRFRRALRTLHHRRDPEAIPALLELLANEAPRHPVSVRTLWMLHACGGLDAECAARLFEHRDPAVRRWIVRLLGDDGKTLAAPERAADDPALEVRLQAACSAKRAGDWAALRALVHADRKEDRDDPFLPLCVWWGMESLTRLPPEQGIERLVKLFMQPALQRTRFFRAHLLERLARRALAEGTPEFDAAAAELFKSAGDDDARALILTGFAAASAGRKPTGLPAALVDTLSVPIGMDQADGPAMRTALHFADRYALAVALNAVKGEQYDLRRRKALLDLLGRTAPAFMAPDLAKLASHTAPAALRPAALAAAVRHDAPETRAAALAIAKAENGALRNQALAALCARPSWAKELLKELDAGTIKPADLPVDVPALLSVHDDPALKAAVAKRWGSFRGAPAAEKLAKVHGIKVSLKLAKGDAKAGRELFTKRCGNCHTLFGAGAKVGPELTGTDRKNLDYLLMSVVDPAAAIRKEYASQLVRLADGRTLVGLLSDAGGDGSVLIDAKAEKHALRKSDIEEIRPSPQSLMPDGLFDDLSAQQVRDLMAYLTAAAPPQ